MSIREWINRNTLGALVVTVLALVAALGLTLWRSGGTGGPVEAYFFDLDTGELFTAAARQLPPIETPGGGHQGVSAHIFACGECPAPVAGLTLDALRDQGGFVAYFERYSDSAKMMLEAGFPPETPEEEELREALAEDPEQAALVRRPDDEEWVELRSEAGDRIAAAAWERPCPDGTAPTRCRP